LFPYLTIINGYGPTENTTFSICHTIVEEHNASIPLGKPISNSYVYILNDNKEPVPVGVEGEIYVGGEGLALGYLNQPELTAEKFMADPFRSTEKIYRTGDIGKWLPDGNVEFVGRKDDQIKLRGYRIEPNEIAHTIRHHSGVQDAIVQVTNLGQPDAELICVVIPHPERAFTLNRLARLRRERGSLLTRILPNNLIVAHNNISETGFLYTEIFEDHTYHKNGIELKEGDVVFDVGANIGMFSLYVALHYPNTKIYSLEPVKPTYETLRANSMLYPVSIKPIHCGASSQTQTVQFTHYPFNTVMSGRYGDDSSVDKEILRGYFGKQQEGDTDKATTEQIDEMLDERMKAEYYDCQLRRISDIIREEGVTKIDLLKIDVEKSELDALMGIDKEHWNIIQQVSIEIHDINGQLEKIKSLMEENGFSYHVEQEDILTNTHLYNIYATKLKKSTRKETGLPERSKDAYEWLIPEVFLKALKEHCQQKLPDYMVPSRFYMVDQFPLTDNGKVDMKKLFAMDSMSTDKTVAHEGPMNSIEEALLAVWKEVLGREDIGTTDNFFEIGGHSLKAIQVISHVAKQLNTKLELGAIFSKPTIRELAVELQRSNVTALQEIPKLKEQPNYALSYAQRRLWLICQNEKENVAYTMPGAVRLSGDLDREAFSKAFNVLVERHESLRTTFSLISGEPQQIIHQRSELSGLEVMFTDLRQEENCEELVRATIESAVSTPFQLEKGPLIQVRLLQEQDMQHTLVFTMHHIISDGRSIDVLLHDFLTAYNAFSLGKENPLTPLPIQYKDFAAWHNASISANEVQSHRKFWLETLSGELPVLSMATDFPRPTIKTATGKLVRFTLGSTLCQQLKAYAQESGSSVYILLQATIKAWLHYYTKQRDIIIGSPVSGREQAALNDQIGYYMNTMVIRTRFTPTQSFHTLLEQVKQDTAKVFMHQHYPFDLLVEDLHIKMDRSRNILFDVGFNLNMQNEVSLHEEHAFQQITVTNIPIGFGTTKTDLWFNAHDKMDELGFTVEYNTDLFREATIETMVSNYLFLLEAIAANKAITLVELNEQIQQNEMLYIRSKQEKASSSGFAQLMNTSATGIKQV
jgi:FkbM family methyltransferase